MTTIASIASTVGPMPALQGLDKAGSVIFLGSFNKVLFPSLRLGYLVAPTTLLDPLLALRLGVDFHPPTLDQAILCDFITEGHLGRHIRRMRDMYAERLAALQHEARKYLSGLLDVSPIQAGLNTAGFLRNGMSSRQAEALAANHGIEALGLDRFTLTTQFQGRFDAWLRCLRRASDPSRDRRAGGCIGARRPLILVLLCHKRARDLFL